VCAWQCHRGAQQVKTLLFSSKKKQLISLVQKVSSHPTLLSSVLLFVCCVCAFAVLQHPTAPDISFPENESELRTQGTKLLSASQEKSFFYRFSPGSCFFYHPPVFARLKQRGIQKKKTADCLVRAKSYVYSFDGC